MKKIAQLFKIKYNIKDFNFWCVDSGGETPDTIPNSAVKPASAEGSARVTWCENRKMHLLYKKARTMFWLFFCLFFKLKLNCKKML